MPRADGTGPSGIGPTGWRRNGCTVTGAPIVGTGMNYGAGRGLSRGYGFKRGPGLGRGLGPRCFGFVWGVSDDNVNSDYLNAQAKNLEEQAARLRKLADEKKQAE